MLWSTYLGHGRLGSVRCGAARPRGDFAPRGPSRGADPGRKTTPERQAQG